MKKRLFRLEGTVSAGGTPWRVEASAGAEAVGANLMLYLRAGGMARLLRGEPEGPGRESWLDAGGKEAIRAKLTEGKWRQAQGARPTV